MLAVARWPDGGRADRDQLLEGRRVIQQSRSRLQRFFLFAKDAQQTLESAVREHPDDAEATHTMHQLPNLRCQPTMLQIFRQLLSIYEQLKDSKGQYYCHRRLAMHPVVGHYMLDRAEPTPTCARCSLALQRRPRRLRAPVRVARVEIKIRFHREVCSSAAVRRSGA